MVTKNDLPRPERDVIEKVDQAQIYAFDEGANEYVPLAVNADGELEVDASGGGAVDVSDRDTRALGNVDVTTSPLDAALKSNGGDPLLVEANATLPVQEDTPLDVSGAVVDVQENTALDVSGAVVTVVETAHAGLTTGQDATSGANSSQALNAGNALAVPDGATVRVKALNGNGGPIYVGDSTVTTDSGYELPAGQDVPLDVDDVSTLYIVDSTGGYGVSWVVEQ